MNQSFTGFSAIAALLGRAVARTLPAALAGFLLATCTAFYTKEPVVYRKNVAVYKVPAGDYPGGSIGDSLTLVQPFPKMKVAELIDALGNLEYKRQSAWGETQSRIFYDEELRLAAPAIVEAMANTGPEYRLIVVTRFDRDKSVLSRMERNSMVLWTDEDGLNVTFGEIREEIPNNDFRIDGDWTEVLPVSFSRAYPDLELVPEDFFSFKQVGGYTHLTWAVIKVSDLAGLKYRPVESESADVDKKEKSDGETKSSTKTMEESRKDSAPRNNKESYFDEAAADPANATENRDPTERLRKLKQALDEELISEEEFKTQRQRILDDY